MVIQNPNQMISQPMIFDEVAFGLRARGVPQAEIQSRVEKALQVCGLYPFRNWPVSALSFGQKKRVTVASILALDPKVIILDEPTAGQGVTVIMITHDMHLMLEYTNRSLVFCGGELVADLPPAQVLCDRALCKQANLKETSLFTLCGRVLPQAEPSSFVQSFIDFDRRERER